MYGTVRLLARFQAKHSGRPWLPKRRVCVVFYKKVCVLFFIKRCVVLPCLSLVENAALVRFFVISFAS